MSDEENEEQEYKPKAKQVDINVNVQQGQGKKTTVTDKMARQVAEELSAILGETIEPAKLVSEYEAQKNKLKLEIAKEIGKGRENRSRKEALERASSEGGATATGTATLTAEQATGGSAEGSTDYGDLPLSFREYPSKTAMFADLKKEASNPESEFCKEAQNLLTALHRRVGRSREQLSAELENVGDVARGKKAKWKIKREDEQ